ncbi:MAG TPA: hypothetical protein VK789_18030 [Bryobacteraceae bacterium]|nr:hypothetical protein [Bryobacteraceae bacterium]
MRKKYVSGLLLAASLGAFAQTRIDVGNQSRNFRLPTGSNLPATCSVGQLFFMTAAPGGVNQCVAANTWAAIQNVSSSGNSGTNGPAAGSIAVEQTSSTQLTIGPGCSIATPCLYRIGSSVFSLLAPAMVTVTGGSGFAIMYVDTNGNLTVGVSATGSPGITCSGCLVLSSITQFPVGAIPLETWNATNGTWDASGTSSMATLSAPPAVLGGSNISVTQAAGNVTISYTGIDGAGTAPSPIGTFNPLDPTQFYVNHLALTTGFSRGWEGWDYSDACGNGSPPSGPAFSAESVVAAEWGQAAGAGTTCAFYFPGIHGTGASGAAYDYWSGNSPANLWVSTVYQSADANGSQYVGLSNSGNGVSNFIGCRQTGAGNWFAVIRSGGIDVATTDTGFPHDTAVHRLTVDNNSASANSIRCSVDGGNTATATGGIPAQSGGWFFIAGTVATGSAGANFGMYQHTIFLQGLPRL